MTKYLQRFLTEWFDQYVNRYRDADSLLPAALELKYTHSRRVAENARLIACGLAFAEEDVLLAEGCGLLHDIGRFAQYKNYGSFSDPITVDHGREGRQILEAEGLSSLFPDDEWLSITCVVEYHNRKAEHIPPDLGSKVNLFLQLIRDADKLDIMEFVLQSVSRDGFSDLPDMLPHISLSRILTPPVLDEIQKTKTVSTGNLRTVTDFLLMLASWFYDFNCAPAKQLAVKRKIIDNLERELPDTQDVRKLIDNIKAHLKQNSL